jgi:sulfonate transport system permease protein
LREIRSTLIRILLGILLPALLLATWWWSTDIAHLFTENQLPPPERLLSALRELNRQGDYSRHLLASLRRVALGFGAGAGIAVVLGTLVGLSKTLEQIVDPTLQGLRSVPSLAWVPFLLLWLGIDESPKITLIAIGAFFPVYVNLVSGIRQVDRKLVEVGEIFVLNTRERVLEIFLPAAVPYAMTGLRIGLGQAWLFLVAAELIASTRGLGFLLIDGQNNLRPDLMLVSILTLALLGKSADSFLRLLEGKLLGWSDTFGERR